MAFFKSFNREMNLTKDDEGLPASQNTTLNCVWSHFRRAWEQPRVSSHCLLQCWRLIALRSLSLRGSWSFFSPLGLCTGQIVNIFIVCGFDETGKCDSFNRNLERPLITDPHCDEKMWGISEEKKMNFPCVACFQAHHWHRADGLGLSLLASCSI